MNEFAELGKLLEQIETSTSTVEFSGGFFGGRWWIDVTQITATQNGIQKIVIATENEHRLDTALTLVLQDLRDMANE